MDGMFMLAHEQELWQAGYRLIGGVDEVGAGALFGPLIAACVILDPENIPEGLADSKKLTEKKRERLYEAIVSSAIAWGIGSVDPATVDEINPRQAARLAMKRAVEAMPIAPDFLLIDMHQIDLPIPQRAFPKADMLSASVAAASIVAKVTRDRLIVELAAQFHPDYDLARNKGYGSARHIAALRKHGPTELHRLTFIRKPLATK